MPMNPKVSLSKLDCPEVVDPLLDVCRIWST
jgi:hypothetical protein